MSKAEDLLLDKYNWDTSHPDYSTASFRKDEVLRVMKEMVSLSYAAGMECAFRNTTLVQKGNSTGIKKNFAQVMRDKNEYIAKLFGE